MGLALGALLWLAIDGKNETLLREILILLIDLIVFESLDAVTKSGSAAGCYFHYATN